MTAPEHVFALSGGVTSWGAARVALDRGLVGDAPAVALFADTLFEDASTYRFLDESVQDLGLPLVRLTEGRTPYELFLDECFLGNSRAALCSRKLKRAPLDRWRKQHCDPSTSWHYVGLDYAEVNRFERHREALRPWRARAPLIDFGVDKRACLAMARARGMTLPDAYADGFSHSNCQGLCVQGGQGHWGRLLRLYPDRFEEAMLFEEQWQAKTGKDHTFLTRQRNNQTERLPLRQLKAELDNEPALFPVDEGGGCGCALAGQEPAPRPLLTPEDPL